MGFNLVPRVSFLPWNPFPRAGRRETVERLGLIMYIPIAVDMLTSDVITKGNFEPP